MGRRLRELRHKRGLSLNGVADRLGVHFSTIGKYERGVRQPNLDALRRLAELYEVDIAELLGTGEQAFRGDAVHRLRERPDLEVLLEIARRLAPDEVLLLTDLLRTLTDRVRRRRDRTGVPDQTTIVAPPPVRVGGPSAAEAAEPAGDWRQVPAAGGAAALPSPSRPRPARVRAAGRPARPRSRVRSIARGPAPPLLPCVLPAGTLEPYRRRRADPPDGR